ncbi:MAG: hypothetical protein L0220_24125 [Acidobacteria bacterium]|nr:hypothetical protein [Acidobacteriota bacterium]
MEMLSWKISRVKPIIFELGRVTCHEINGSLKRLITHRSRELKRDFSSDFLVLIRTISQHLRWLFMLDPSVLPGVSLILGSNNIMCGLAGPVILLLDIGEADPDASRIDRGVSLRSDL